MLLTVAVGLLLQSPQDMKTWVDRGFDAAQPDAYTVSGPAELSRTEAWAAVNRIALEDQRDRLRRHAEQAATGAAPGWLPAFVKDQVVKDWTREQMRARKLRVRDRDLIVRDHDFGRSYQAFLLLDEVEPALTSRRHTLGRRLAREEHRFLAKCGGTVGLWAILALLLAWIDRLSRGYMTGRLYLIGAAVGLCTPIVLLLL